MAVALIISALATVSTSFAVAEFHSDVMLFYAEYIVLFSLQIVLADYHKSYIFHFIIIIESKQIKAGMWLMRIVDIK